MTKKEILFEVPEGSGKFYKREDLTATMQPYEDAVARDANGNIRSENDDLFEYDDSWFYPGQLSQGITNIADDHKIVFDGNTVVNGDLEVDGDITITGDLTVHGNTTTIDDNKLYIDTAGLGGYEESEDVVITGPPAEDDYVTIKFKTIEGESVELSTKWAIPEETPGKTYFANRELYEKYTTSVKIKDIVYVNSEDAYYYLEDLKPNGKPYDDAKPLSDEFAEKQLKEKQKSVPGSRNLLDLF